MPHFATATATATSITTAAAIPPPTAPLLPLLYQERARLCLLQASVLVASPELRGADEGHAHVGALLSSAAQDAGFARDEALGREAGG